LALAAARTPRRHFPLPTMFATVTGMKKILILAVLVGLSAFAAKKLKG
jgi:hypothetical protein